MLIKSIEYKNFRQFENSRIEFSTDPTKNTTIILAGNTNGKSTIVESFRWCFYGELNLPKPKEVANRTAFNKLENQESLTVSVKVELTHQNADYIVEREQVLKNVYGNKRYNVSTISISKKNINGVYEDVTTKMDISEIVPLELMSYFFFTGERFDVLVDNKADGKRDISNAVRSILGLEPVEFAISDLDKVKESYRIKMITQMGDSAEQLTNSLNTISNEIKTVKDKINKLKIEKLEVISKKDDLFNRLQNNPNEEREKRLKEINSKIKEHNNIIDLNTQSLKMSFKKMITPSIFEKIYLCNKDKFDNLKPNESNFTGIDLATLERILTTKTCICGRDILEDTKEYNTIVEIIDQLKKKNLNINEDRAVSKVNSFINNSKNVSELFFVENTQRMRNLSSSLEQLESLELQKNDALLYDDNQESFETNKKLYEGYHETEINIQREIDDLENEVIEKEKSLDEINSKIDEYYQKEKTNNALKLKSDYCDKIQEELKFYYSNQEKTILNKLNKKVANLFENLIRTKHTIEIDSKYKFKVKDVDGVEATSDGADVLTAMAFIGGLISLAKENSETLNSYEPYPLVLDSPFGKLEKTHQQSVSKFLPGIPEQFVLLVSDSQFSDTVSESLESKIGKMWTIETEYSSEGDKKAVVKEYKYLED